MKTTLQFVSLLELASFQTAIQMHGYRIDTSALSLSGTFSEVEIQLAQQKYKARLLLTEYTVLKVA